MLGLGTQIRAHIERRFSMPWSNPAARIRGSCSRSARSGRRGTKTHPSRSTASSTSSPDDAGVLAAAEPARRAPRAPRRGRRPHVRDRRRGGRRHRAPQLQHAALPEVPDHPGGRTWLCRGRPERRRRRLLCDGLVVTGADDAAMARADVGDTRTHRVLRVDARLPGRARRGRPGDTCRTSSTSCRVRVRGRRCRRSSPTRCWTRSRSSVHPTRSGSACKNGMPGSRTGGVRHPVRPRPRNTRPRPRRLRLTLTPT